MADITGSYSYHGAAMQTDGARLYEFTAQVEVESVGEGPAVRVVITTDHKESRSVSEPAIPQVLPDGTIKLLYDYVADPDHAATAAHDFFGMVRLRFTPDGRRAQGSYLNFNGRYTCGECRWDRAA